MTDAAEKGNNKSDAELENIKNQILKILDENEVGMSIDHNHWDGWCMVLSDKNSHNSLWIKNNDLP